MDKVMVTQADRDAAAPYAVHNTDIATARLQHAIAQGKHDNHPLVQAFARHRIAALEEAAGVAATIAKAKRNEARSHARPRGGFSTAENNAYREASWANAAETAIRSRMGAAG